ncbi:hypothetical protein DL237_11235 [Pseudooceanicola sediminis]|uniref:Uncharacterized protein n=1 Tax=Pseudooceanicola sediminis TaxID=2211117 RepID=A0A399IZ76_9RHOB|nr:hypothetical protein [Pseudooceanicola sediminis]KAA2313710.1 hypothetical protein E0K93_13800 [Puniceibacterium sp. HSS470]RII38453.1 hypothetical protein DL237_11235 [Pseudooceanicola sediminis]|tara:strand:+ start:128912 stop:129682 length:771 start_codon:yes stop_codon:yes gene_type:complete
MAPLGPAPLFAGKGPRLSRKAHGQGAFARLALRLSRRLAAGLAIALVLSLATGLATGAAQAGAWPRGKGKHFAAAALRFHSATGADWSKSLTYYHEYGLSDQINIGVDVGGAISGFDKLILFATVPLPQILGVNIASELGVGLVAGEAVVRPGVSLGRGLSRPEGWITLEGAAEYFSQSDAVDWKVDTTFGLTLGARSKTYVQLQTGHQHGDAPFARLAASFAWQIKPRLTLDVGASTSVMNSERYRLKFGVWREF